MHRTGDAAAANFNDEVVRDIAAAAVAMDLVGIVIPNIGDASFRL